MGTARRPWAALLCAVLLLLVEGALDSDRVPPPPPGATARPPAAAFVLNKCCALDELLNAATTACVPFGNSSVTEKASWWMEVNVLVGPDRQLKEFSKLPLNATVLYNKRPCGPELTAISWTNEVAIHLNGSLQMELLQNADPGRTESFLLPPEDYCVDLTRRGGGLSLGFLACPCKHVVCVRKCCDKKRMLTVGEAIAMHQKASCRERLPPSVTWNASLIAISAGAERRQANVSYARLRGPFSHDCPSGRMNTIIEMSDKINASLLSNGTLLAAVTGSPFRVDQFCVDYSKHKEKYSLYAFVCAKNKDVKPMSWKNYLYLVLYLVGLASLVATLVVYAVLPDLRRPVYAKALMCHAAALAAALLTLAVSECISANSYAACAALAFSGQLFLLAAFFWLTVLSFDFTRGLRDLLPINAQSAGRRLLFYSLFAWSGPIVIVAVTAALNYAPGLPDWVQRPEIGLFSCWFSPNWAKFCYYYGPVACLLLANVGMFTHTMLNLRAAQNERRLLKNRDSCRTGGNLKKQREWMLLYAKLFSLMGLTWLLEVVVWAAGADDITMACVDAVNVLRGVGVFAACCCKRNVLDAFRDRLSDLMPCLGRRRDEVPMSYTESTDLSTRASPDGVRLQRAASNDST